MQGSLDAHFEGYFSQMNAICGIRSGAHVRYSVIDDLLLRCKRINFNTSTFIKAEEAKICDGRNI